MQYYRKKLPSIADLGQTDRASTPTSAGLRPRLVRIIARYLIQYRQAARLVALGSSGRRHNGNLLLRPSVCTRVAHTLTLTFDL